MMTAQPVKRKPHKHQPINLNSDTIFAPILASVAVEIYLISRLHIVTEEKCGSSEPNRSEARNRKAWVLTRGDSRNWYIEETAYF